MYSITVLKHCILFSKCIDFHIFDYRCFEWSIQNKRITQHLIGSWNNLAIETLLLQFVSWQNDSVMVWLKQQHTQVACPYLYYLTPYSILSKLCAIFNVANSFYKYKTSRGKVLLISFSDIIYNPLKFLGGTRGHNKFFPFTLSSGMRFIWFQV